MKKIISLVTLLTFLLSMIGFSLNSMAVSESFTSIQSFDNTPTANTDYKNYTNPTSFTLSLANTGAPQNYSQTALTSNSLKIEKTSSSSQWTEVLVLNPSFGTTVTTQPTYLDFYIDLSNMIKATGVNISLINSQNHKYELPDGQDSYNIQKAAVGASYSTTKAGYKGIWFGNGGSDFRKGFIRINISDFKLNGNTVTDIGTIKYICLGTNANNLDINEYITLDSLNFVGQGDSSSSSQSSSSTSSSSSSSQADANHDVVDSSAISTQGAVNLAGNTVFSVDGASLNVSIVASGSENAIRVEKTSANWSTFCIKTKNQDYSGNEFIEFFIDGTSLSSSNGLALYIFDTTGMRYDLPGFGGYINFQYELKAEGNSSWVTKRDTYNSLGNLYGFKGLVRIPLNTFVRSYWYVNPKPAQTAEGYATLPADLDLTKISKIGFGNGANMSFVVKNILFKNKEVESSNSQPQTSSSTQINSIILDLDGFELGNINLTSNPIFTKDMTNIDVSVIVQGSAKALKIEKTLSGWSTFKIKSDSKDYSGNYYLEFYIDTTSFDKNASIATYIFTTDAMRYDLPGYNGFKTFKYEVLADGTSAWVTKTDKYNALGSLANFKGKVRIPTDIFVQSAWYSPHNIGADGEASDYESLAADLDLSLISQIGFGTSGLGTYIVSDLKFTPKLITSGNNPVTKDTSFIFYIILMFIAFTIPFALLGKNQIKN